MPLKDEKIQDNRIRRTPERHAQMVDLHDPVTVRRRSTVTARIPGGADMHLVIVTTSS